MGSTTKIAKLNKFEDETLLRDLVNLVLTSTVENQSREDVAEFAKERGISNVGALKSLVDDLRSLAVEAVKKNTSASQLKTDLVTEGLGESQATIFAEVCMRNPMADSIWPFIFHRMNYF